MTYEEAIAFWYGRIDYERRQPRPGDLKLDRMRALLRLLGDPHRRLRCVHIAGTKGKGSSSAMLASVLRAAGHRTGLFTSPHLRDISERVQVDGVPISREEIAARMSEVASAVRELEHSGDPTRSPTFFEIITALGFLHFDCRRVDIAVLEVGLGGKFDSTNVCEPLLCLLTNISYDHMAILGNTLAEIAEQKAGIIKRGVPVVSAADDPAAVAVIAETAKANDAPLSQFERDFRCVYAVEAPFTLPRVRVATTKRDWGWLSLGLFGEHQARNAAGVVATIERLRELGLALPDRAVRQGLQQTSWPARLELMKRDPVVILDCAHNVASALALVKTLTTSFPIEGSRELIFAASNDKQISEMLGILAPHFDRFHLTRYVSNPRSADPLKMAEYLRELGQTQIEIHPTPEAAWHTAFARSQPNAGIVIAGSVFLAGELRGLIQETLAQR